MRSVTKRDITAALGDAVTGPNQLKAFCRAGMGRCQGRSCGLIVQEMIANDRQQTMAETGYYRVRPPVKPVTLAELASLDGLAGVNKPVVSRPIVIGAGIQGCSTAFFLAPRPARHRSGKDHVARHASGVNAGGVRRLAARLSRSPCRLRLWIGGLKLTNCYRSKKVSPPQLP